MKRVQSSNIVRQRGRSPAVCSSAPMMRMNLKELFVAVATVAVLVVGPASGANDGTLVPEAKGAEVVEMTTDRIEASCIFPDDKLLMRRLAYVESNDGLHPDAFRKGYYGGIWQVRLSL